MTLDCVKHLSTLDQGTKRNVFQFSFVPYLEVGIVPPTSSDSSSTIVPETVLKPPTLPAFYPHSDGPLRARCILGSDLKPRSITTMMDLGLLGRCHLTGDL